MHHYEVHSWPHKEDEAAAIWLQNTDGSGLNNGSLLLVRDKHCYGVVCVPLKSVLSVSKYLFNTVCQSCTSLISIQYHRWFVQGHCCDLVR